MEPNKSAPTEIRSMGPDYVDLLTVLQLLREHIAALIACTVLAAAAGFVLSAFLLVPQYEASALMIVNTRQDQSANVTNDQLTSAKNLVSTYSIIIKSNTVMDQVRSDLGLSLSSSELSEHISVDAVDSTQVMKISAVDADAEWARQVVEDVTKVAPNVIVEKVEAGSVKVISEATITPEPVSPNVKQYTVLAGLLGVVACFAVIFLRERFDNKIKTEEDVSKYLDLPVIGVIPEYEPDTNGK